MKFLKGMLSRPAETLDHYGPGAATDDEDAMRDEDWEDYGPIESPHQGAVVEGDQNGVILPQTDHDEGGMVASNVAAFPADMSDGHPDQADFDDEEDDLDEAEGQEARRATQPDSVKIWELFDEDKDALEGQDSMEENVTAPQSNSNDREVSERSLAREALAMIQARTPEALRDLDTPNTPPGRAKTRLIGFAGRDSTPVNLFQQTSKPLDSAPKMFPVGWLIIIEGPGRGASFTLFSGLTQIGRAEDQSISLNFGDHAISRENHASIAYDDEDNMFYLGHGGKANIVRLNGRPVLSTEELSNGDLIRIGETTMRFVALCGSDFAWDLTQEDEE